MQIAHPTFYKISLIALALLFSGIATITFAQESGGIAPIDSVVTAGTPSVIFPITELGDCSSKTECKLYCDEASHREACFAYAQSHGLMNKDQIATARVLLSKKGPGGCSSRESCKNYCEESSHTDVCVAFAQSHSLVPLKQLEAIKKIKTEGGPGACKNAQECRLYCTDTTHMNECRAFARNYDIARPKSTSTLRVLEKRPLNPNATSTNERSGMPRVINGTTTRPCAAAGNCPSGGEVRPPLKVNSASSTPQKVGGYNTTAPKPPLPGAGTQGTNAITPNGGTPLPPPNEPTPTGPRTSPPTGRADLPAAIYSGFLYLLGY